MPESDASIAVMEQKNFLRKALKEALGRQSHLAACQKSVAAQRHLLDAPVWAQATVIAIYASVRGETDTAMLLEAAMEMGKKAILPRVAGKASGIMEFALCENPGNLVSGPWGIPQPGEDASTWTDAPDLMIMPGLAFDSRGNRLGHGAGYYDRFLMANPHWECPRIGFCFSFQLVAQVPHAQHDFPIHGICSEMGLTWL